MTGGSDVSIGLRISVEGTGGTISALGNVTQGVKNLGTASKETKTSLASIAAAAAGPLAALYAAKQAAEGFIATSRKLIQIADDYAGVTARMNLVSKSAVEMNTAMAGVFKTAQDARAPLAETAQLYYRLATAAAQMGLSQKETLTITDAIAKSLKISGASSTETAGALQQLSQALQAGKLNGDEFRSVTENAARVVTALTDSLHIDIGTLREWSQQGKLTSEVVAKALVEQSGAIERDFAKIPITVEGAIQQLKNASELFIGMAGQAIPIGKALAEMFTEVAKSISEAALQLKGFFPSSSTSDQIVAFETRIGQLQEKLKGMSGSWFFDPDDYERTVRAIEEMQIKLEDLRKQQTANAAAAGSFFSGQKPTPAADPKAQEAAQRLLQAQVKQRIEAEKAGFEEFKAQQEVRLKTIEAEKNALRDVAKLQINSATTYKDAQSAAIKLNEDLNAKLDEEYRIRDDLLQVQARISSVTIDAYNSELAKAKEINLTDAEQVTIKTAIAEAESNIKQIQYERAQLEVDTGEKERQLANDLLERKAEEQKFLQKINEELKFQEELYTRLNEARAKGATTQDLELMRNTMEQSRSLGLNLPPEGVGIATETIKKTEELKQKNDELTDSYKNVREAALRALEVASSNLEYAKEVSSGLSDAFGQVGESIGGMTVALAEYAKQQETINVARQEAIENAKGDQTKIAEAEKDAAEKRTKAQVKSYGDMAQAGQKFFKQGTKGYEAMGVAVKVFRAFEMAQSAMSFVKQMGEMGSLYTSFVKMLTEMGILSAANTSKEIAQSGAAAGAKAAEGAAQQGTSGDPYTAFARVAAWVALMAGLGIMIGGGGGGGSATAVKPPEPGTGTVMGDPTAVSESISKSIAIIEENSSNDLNYSADMLDALYQIRDALGGVENLIASDLTPAISNLMLKFGDGVKQAGFLFRDQSLSKVLASGKLEGYIGARVETESSQMMVTIKKGQTMVAEYGDKFARAFGGVVTAIKDSIVEVGKVIGITDTQITERLKGFKIKLGTIDIAGLSAEEGAKKIEAAFSAMSDTMAMKALPEFKDFKQSGEGYKETIVRVAEGIQRATDSLELLGMEAISYTDITNKNKDVAAEITRQTIMAQGDLSEGTRKYVEQLKGSAQDIIDSYKQILNITKLMRGAGFNAENLDRTMINAAGGMSALEEAMQSFRDNFMSDAQKVSVDTAELTDAFGKLGFSLPKSKDEFYKLAMGIDTSTEQGKKLFAQFMNLNQQFSDLTDASKDLADAQAEAAQKAADAAQKAYDDMVSNAQKSADSASSAMSKAFSDLQKIQERFANLTKTMKGFLSDIAGPGSQYASPEERYLMAKAEFERVSVLAGKGDEDALASLTDVSKEFLAASKDYNASSVQFQTDLKSVTDAVEESIKYTEKQVSLASTQLSVAQKANDSLTSINTNTLTMIQGINNLITATNNYSGAIAELANVQAAKPVSTVAPVAPSAPSTPSAPTTTPAQTPTVLLPQIPGGAAGKNYFANSRKYKYSLLDAQNIIRFYYYQLLGRSVESDVVLNEWAANLTSGSKSADEVATLFKQSSEFTALVAKGFVPGFAKGGMASPGLAIVGEQGPELVSFGSPAHVSTAGKTENFFSGLQNSIVEGDKNQLNELQALVRLQSEANKQLIRQMGELKAEMAEFARKAKLEAAA